MEEKEKQEPQTVGAPVELTTECFACDELFVFDPDEVETFEGQPMCSKCCDDIRRRYWARRAELEALEMGTTEETK